MFTTFLIGTHMHPNPIFRNKETKLSLDFADKISFGTLCISAEPTPLLSHIPFQINADRTSIDLHLVRSNPISRALIKAPRQATLAIMGPHGYISPDWYEVKDQVPTWNYVTVHISGTLSLLDQNVLPDVIDSLSDHFETQLAPKPVWKMEKVDEDIMTKMQRQIVPCRLDISQVESTWKLGQNKAASARHAAADQLEKSTIGSNTPQLAALMRSAE